MTNMRKCFCRGQTVFLVVTHEGHRRIMRTTVTGVTSTHVQLQGGVPDSWRHDRAIASMTDKYGIRGEIAPDYVHPTREKAEEQLRRVLLEDYMALKEAFLNRSIHSLRTTDLVVTIEPLTEK